MYYDFRDRLIEQKDGALLSSGSPNTSGETDSVHRPITFLTYDNLDEVTETDSYDGDGVSVSGSAPSSSLLRGKTVDSFDNQGRVYESQTYSVDPSSGSVSTNALTTLT